MPTNVEVKEEKFELDALFLMEENDASEDKTCSTKIGKIEPTSGGTCTPWPVQNKFGGEPKNYEGITPSTPPRAQSPDIYSDQEPADDGFHIPLNHLKIEDKSSSAKKSVTRGKLDMKRKEAAKYICKSMPTNRRQLFLAAINGPRSDSLVSKKRKRHASLFHAKRSPKKMVKISPKRALRQVTVNCSVGHLDQPVKCPLVGP